MTIITFTACVKYKLWGSGYKPEPAIVYTLSALRALLMAGSILQIVPKVLFTIMQRKYFHSIRAVSLICQKSSVSTFFDFGDLNLIFEFLSFH